MITYELAKQLKDSGFPWKKDWKGEVVFDPGAPEGEAPLTAYAPTLEELIEACGKWFLYLKRREFDGRVDFLAVSKSIRYAGRDIEEEFKGNEPDEAVANLYKARFNDVCRKLYPGNFK